MRTGKFHIGEVKKPITASNINSFSPADIFRFAFALGNCLFMVEPTVSFKGGDVKVLTNFSEFGKGLVKSDN